jgi:hypothetical protein
MYPYCAGALENTVRRFVQGPVGHELGVRSVGQRPAAAADRMHSVFGSAPEPSSFARPRRMMSLM